MSGLLDEAQAEIARRYFALGPERVGQRVTMLMPDAPSSDDMSIVELILPSHCDPRPARCMAMLGPLAGAREVCIARHSYAIDDGSPASEIDPVLLSEKIDDGEDVEGVMHAVSVLYSAPGDRIPGMYAASIDSESGDISPWERVTTEFMYIGRSRNGERTVVMEHAIHPATLLMEAGLFYLRDTIENVQEHGRDWLTGNEVEHISGRLQEVKQAVGDAIHLIAPKSTEWKRR